jgi:tol-pal system-associated acyl-CoA thioesterase
MAKTHSCAYRVCYADTDLMDRVYYANYFVIAERARTEFLRDVGHSYKSIEASGVFFPVRSCDARYHNYAEYDDLLECRSHIGKMRHATLSFVTEIRRGDEAKPLVVATVELACVGQNGKPCVIPDNLRQALLPYVEE